MGELVSKSKRVRQHHFVHDGYERACDAAHAQIRADVEREYAERLAAAGWIGRWVLQREIEREIERRLELKAPPWGLYLSREP